MQTHTQKLLSDAHLSVLEYASLPTCPRKKGPTEILWWNFLAVSKKFQKTINSKLIAMDRSTILPVGNRAMITVARSVLLFLFLIEPEVLPFPCSAHGQALLGWCLNGYSR